MDFQISGESCSESLGTTIVALNLGGKNISVKGLNPQDFGPPGPHFFRPPSTQRNGHPLLKGLLTCWGRLAKIKIDERKAVDTDWFTSQYFWKHQRKGPLFSACKLANSTMPRSGCRSPSTPYIHFWATCNYDGSIWHSSYTLCIWMNLNVLRPDVSGSATRIWSGWCLQPTRTFVQADHGFLESKPTQCLQFSNGWNYLGFQELRSSSWRTFKKKNTELGDIARFVRNTTFCQVVIHHTWYDLCTIDTYGKWHPGAMWQMYLMILQKKQMQLHRTAKKVNQWYINDTSWHVCWPIQLSDLWYLPQLWVTCMKT